MKAATVEGNQVKQNIPSPARGVVTTDGNSQESFFAYVARTFLELWSFRYVTASLIINSLRSRYRGAFLGFLWSLLNPLLSMIVLTCVFALIFACDIRQFAPHIFSGLLPWALISASLEKGAQSLVAAEGTLKKIYAPKTMFPLVPIGVEAANFLFCVPAFYAIGAFLGLHPHPALALLPVVVAITCLFCLGLSLILAVATVYFRDLSHILSILLSVIFYMLPILYPIGKIPEQFRWFIYCNPFYSLIALYQDILRDGIIPGLNEFVTPCLLAVGTLVIGLAVIKAKENNIIFRL